MHPILRGQISPINYTDPAILIGVSGRTIMKKRLNLTDEPYIACIDCTIRRSRKCNGLRTTGLPLLEWCKLIRAVKEFEGFTNQEVANGADVSIKTIERIVALNCDQDIRRETARRIENFVLGDSPSFPCFLAFQENAPEVSQRVSNAMRDLERELDEKHLAALDNLRDSHSSEMLAIKTTHAAEKSTIIEENAAKIKYLREQIQRLQRDNDNLWTENNRKADLIGRLVEQLDATRSK